MGLEAEALLDEFDRIAQTTKFNGTALLVAEGGGVNLQVGATLRDVLRVGLPSTLSEDVGAISTAKGDGTFGAASSFSAGGSYPTTPAVADLNGDHLLDLVSTLNDNRISVQLGNGDGSFKAPSLLLAGNTGGTPTICDLNKDGKLDLVSKSYTDSALYILVGNGNGTFQTGGFSNVGQGPDCCLGVRP